MVCESCVYLGERKAGEPLSEQTPEAGSQKEQYLLHKSEEQQRPRGRVCTVCHSSAPESSEWDQTSRRLQLAQEVPAQLPLAVHTLSRGLATMPVVLLCCLCKPRGCSPWACGRNNQRKLWDGLTMWARWGQLKQTSPVQNPTSPMWSLQRWHQRGTCFQFSPKCEDVSSSPWQKSKGRAKSEHQVRESKFVNTLAGSGGTRCFGLFRGRAGVFWCGGFVSNLPYSVGKSGSGR